jgi:predicted AlkP superfamily pyrophosphatase or phosphodiesterase
VRKTVVINAVGLTPSLIGATTPRLRDFLSRGKMAAVQPVIPAVTCSVQSTYLTGTWPCEHGVVGNGWYFRDECEVRFWRQSNKLVQRPKVWEIARQRDSSFTCANLFWWYAMYSSADYTVTPRPMYPADGRKLPDVWANPASLRDSLQRELGQFPLFHFWGPAADIRSTRWIAEAAIQVDRQHSPTLTLVYLPHLDYCLQKFGPNDGRINAELRLLDDVVGLLLDHFRDASIILLSEYGISPVHRPVHLNCALRQQGLLAVRDELGHELLDAGASQAFAVADHQVAHVYVNDVTKLGRVRSVLELTPGVARIYDAATKGEIHLDHDRSGDLVVLAEPDSWFTYYYWLEESRRPDFATTVDIHRKPGYDPVELFINPALRVPSLAIASKLMRRKLGFRTLMDVISTDATLVRGSHGLPAATPHERPLLVSSQPHLEMSASVNPTAVSDVILQHIFEQ